LVGKDIQLGYVVVNRRANTLLFEGVGGRFGNPGPGTVVDTVITEPNE
jgi:hypothetical protein